jgi:hypothetical protein
LVAVCVTLAVRGLAVWGSPDAFANDPDAYRAIAATLDQTGVFGLIDAEGQPHATAFRPPLYPALLSLVVVDGRLHPAAGGGLHVLLAACTVTFVFLTTLRLAQRHSGANHRRGVVLAAAAAMLTAVDPILLRQSSEWMTETLAACLASLVIWLWTRHELDPAEAASVSPASRYGIAAVLGLSLALAYLCRPTFVVWAVLLVAASVVRSFSVAGLLRAGLVAVVVASAVLGWTLRNRQAVGHPVWATTHGGYTLLLGNNESFYDYLHEGDWGQAWNAESFLNAHTHRYQGDPKTAAFWDRRWDGPPEFDPAANETSDDRLCYEAAVATIQRRPTDFVWASLVRVGRLWSPFPHDIQGRSKPLMIATGAFYLTLYTAIAIAILRHRRRVLRSQWWAIGLLIVTLTGVHAVYWSNLRMRAPVMPGLMVVAVFAAAPRRTSAGQMDKVVSRGV